MGIKRILKRLGTRFRKPGSQKRIIAFDVIQEPRSMGKPVPKGPYVQIMTLHPELRNLQIRAHNSIRSSGKSQLVKMIANDMGEGKIKWLPEDKVVAAEIFVEFRLGNIEITEEIIKALGLEKEAQFLDTLIKLY